MESGSTPAFLSSLAREITGRFGNDMAHVAVVFPTRRAGVFFRKELASTLQEPAWSPTIYAIQDFMTSLSPYTIPDPVTLLFELFAVYQPYFPGEPFERFYPWGEVLLRDFDEIDRNRVDAEQIFGLVRDLRDIDTAFSLEDEDLDRFRGFWKNFFGRELSGIKSEFLHTWKNLAPIYRDLRDRLHLSGRAYEGMAYRQAADDLLSGKITGLPHRHIVFAGLYALSKSEEAIIGRLIEEGTGSIYWDADHYYLDPPFQEAGTFLRASPLFRDPVSWVGDALTTQQRTITSVGIPLEVGQAKYAGQLLEEWMQEEGFRPEKTAVVLPDEHLLFPVLYSLPEAFEAINVTMGYPLRLTPLYHLFESLILLQRNVRGNNDGQISFYFRDVQQILGHPYVRLLDIDGLRSWQHLHRESRWIRIPAEVLTNNVPPFFRLFFRKVGGLPELFDWFRSILRSILEAMKEQEFRFHRLESEFVFQFHRQLSRLEELIREIDVEQSLDTFWTLFREVVHSARIPFTGEPLQGLQVMGFLETRVLDFDNIILLSVNEQSLPSGTQQPSFIPYNLRKAFHLPTHEDQHAVSAYHFYRMLQRAKRVVMTYNTETKGLTSGEPSRFLFQLEHELCKRHPSSNTFSRLVVTTPVRELKPEPIVVHKCEAVRKRLERYVIRKDKPSERTVRLSASALNTYITCPLRFYFRYVAGLQEQEQVDEDLEAATFGSVLHKAMEHLYEIDREWDAAEIRALLPKVQAAVDTALHEKFIPADQLEGKNVLLRNVILNLAERILANDAEEAPFRIIGLEREISLLLPLDRETKILLYGFIDRLDATAKGVRILDYKTGRIKKDKPVDLETLFQDPAAKEQFQATLYALLVIGNGLAETVRAGLYTVRQLGKGILYLNDGQDYTREQTDQFAEKLRHLVLEILDPEKAFSQTEDPERCEHCAFREICNR